MSRNAALTQLRPHYYDFTSYRLYSSLFIQSPNLNSSSSRDSKRALFYFLFLGIVTDWRWEAICGNRREGGSFVLVLDSVLDCFGFDYNLWLRLGYAEEERGGGGRQYLALDEMWTGLTGWTTAPGCSLEAERSGCLVELGSEGMIG
jgi:hypothetical protein